MRNPWKSRPSVWQLLSIAADVATLVYLLGRIVS
jgi:hypothetical protein